VAIYYALWLCFLFHIYFDDLEGGGSTRNMMITFSFDSPYNLGDWSWSFLSILCEIFSALLCTYVQINFA